MRVRFLADFHFDEMLAMQKIMAIQPRYVFRVYEPYGKIVFTRYHHMSEMLANVPSSLGDISREPHWHPYAMDSTERSTERNKKPGMRISGIALQRM